MTKRTIALIGGGQMGRALIGGMLNAGVAQQVGLNVIDPSEDCRKWWSEKYSNVTVEPSIGTNIEGADVILLAVKPHLIDKVLGEVAALPGGPALVVSIAAGIAVDRLCQTVGHQRVIRVMPNTPSLVGAGASAYCCADAVTTEDRLWVDEALAGVGLAVEVAENQMDAVTGLSGSGPAYVCVMIEALADGGVLMGLPRPLAMQLATQTVMGSAKMVAETGQHPGALKDAVASPGGTTIAALQALEENGLRAALIAAVQASADRSRELMQDL